KADAKLEVIDRVVQELKLAPEGFVKSLEKQQAENDALKSAILGQEARVHDLERKSNELKRSYETALKDAEAKQTDLGADLAKLKGKMENLDKAYEEKKKEVARLENELSAY